MKTRVISRSLAEREPYRIWNAYVDLLAIEGYEDLSNEQRPAHLVFWYESEVQNGGHMQYFENRGVRYLDETIAALGLLGAICQQDVLREAGAQFLGRARPRIKSAKQYSEIALQGEFSSFDSRFHACSPSLQQCLETHLARHQSLFVTLR